MEFKNVAAIVTGGASGLGEGAARALAASGCKVAILDLQKEQGRKVAEDIGGIFLECDVSSPNSAEAAINAAREAHGPCGIAVNCAGIATASKILGREGVMPLENFSKVIQVNLIGTFNILRLAAADMAQREPNADGERGVIINTASVAAYDGQIGQIAYAASKAAITGMTLPMARDLADKGIRVMSIAPGISGTPMVTAFPQEVQDALAAQIPFPTRLGQPEEFARLVGHIAENEMLNGDTIRLDGAVRMPPR